MSFWVCLFIAGVPVPLLWGCIVLRCSTAFCLFLCQEAPRRFSTWAPVSCTPVYVGVLCAWSPDLSHRVFTLLRPVLAGHSRPARRCDPRLPATQCSRFPGLSRWLPRWDVCPSRAPHAQPCPGVSGSSGPAVQVHPGPLGARLGNTARRASVRAVPCAPGQVRVRPPVVRAALVNGVYPAPWVSGHLKHATFGSRLSSTRSGLPAFWEAEAGGPQV